MCKSSHFTALQEATLAKAIELELPQNIINSISYSICIGDLWYVVQLADHFVFRSWFQFESNNITTDVT